MTKLALQQELKEKVKLGVKPSDLKKRTITIPTPPDSPIIEPIKKTKPKPKPESPLVQASKQIKQLAKDVDYWTATANNYLTNLQRTTAELDQAQEEIKKSQLHLAKVNGLGIDPHKQNKICDACLRKVDVIKEREEDFF